MILLFAIWLILLLLFFTWGLISVKVIRIIARAENHSNELSYDEYFFVGFFILSATVGILSIFFPMGETLLLIICFLTILCFVLFFEEIKLKICDEFSSYSKLTKLEKAGIWFFVLFVLSAVVQKITFEDTLTYHAQNIQWIQKYAVVPGLGNIRGAFAFNNMFFTISALFTFTVKNSLIFPLNSLCFVVLGLKLFSQYRNESKQGTMWKSIFYILILLISLLLLLPNLNTPAPDMICNILTVYALLLIIKQHESGAKYDIIHFVLLSLLVFSCVTYKLSSLVLVPALLFNFGTDVSRKIYISVIIGSFIIIPFIVRNYFLSGYVIYPFPAIDIFNVDWKIPIRDVAAMKLEIESFAKIKGFAYDVVNKMKIYEWLKPWFNSKDFTSKFILIINGLSFIPFIIMIIRRDFFNIKIHLLIYLSLLFWLTTAPDLRFVYGFLFTGFSFTIAYSIRLIELSPYSYLMRFRNIILFLLLLIIVFKRINFISDTVLNPSTWIITAPFEKVETVKLNSNFEYRVPAKEGEWCYNTEIPCVTYTLNDVVMRGNNLQSGFKKVIRNQ